jgi:hypothetical protein
LRASQKNLQYWYKGCLKSPLMHGRKDQKNANDSGNTVSGELDEQALTRDLKRFVEESNLSIPKIASKMEFPAQPSVCGLQELLSRLVRSCLRLNVFLNGATEIFRQGAIVRCQKAIVTHKNSVLLLVPMCSRVPRRARVFLGRFLTISRRIRRNTVTGQQTFSD